MCLFKGSMKWVKVQAKGDIPPAVAAHSAVVLGKNIYIFGGMTADGAGNSMYRFNTGTQHCLLLQIKILWGNLVCENLINLNLYFNVIPYVCRQM